MTYQLALLSFAARLFPMSLPFARSKSHPMHFFHPHYNPAVAPAASPAFAPNPSRIPPPRHKGHHHHRRWHLRRNVTAVSPSSHATIAGTWLNEAVSFVVFCLFDIVDSLLCLIYKAADYLLESEWKPCYCLSAKEPITATRGKNLVSHNNGESKILTLSPLQELSGRSKIVLEDISETLYTRPSVLSDLYNLSVNELNKRLVKVTRSDSKCSDHHEKVKNKRRKSKTKSSLKVNFTVVEMLRGKIRPQNLSHDVSRWSDCDCGLCTSWASTTDKNHCLFVKTQIPNGVTAKEDVLFIHGFISSSAFWTETVFPSLLASSSAYRLFAVDLLGFGKSPKPADSLYTLREHVEMIEKSVLHKHNVKSFHIVAHSLGCILALGLAARHGDLIKSLTLLAPVTVLSGTGGRSEAEAVRDEEGGPKESLAANSFRSVDGLLV
ncbi:unnamed protein product [Microthlaspi erraticum]|uniref:AB hydrolase-1 domain-containing protein n=1 Tax=Microthlaspi erraticum TaxID=1685480 RepID=A0A6D2JKG9_9BRAS|nr:unnamed protein product [Microthlaspi erraticum]